MKKLIITTILTIMIMAILSSCNVPIEGFNFNQKNPNPSEYNNVIVDDTSNIVSVA